MKIKYIILIIISFSFFSCITSKKKVDNINYDELKKEYNLYGLKFEGLFYNDIPIKLKYFPTNIFGITQCKIEININNILYEGNIIHDNSGKRNEKYSFDIKSINNQISGNIIKIDNIHPDPDVHKINMVINKINILGEIEQVPFKKIFNINYGNKKLIGESNLTRNGGNIIKKYNLKFSDESFAGYMKFKGLEQFYYFKGNISTDELLMFLLLELYLNYDNEFD